MKQLYFFHVVYFVEIAIRLERLYRDGERPGHADVSAAGKVLVHVVEVCLPEVELRAVAQRPRRDPLSFLLMQQKF